MRASTGPSLHASRAQRSGMPPRAGRGAPGAPQATRSAAAPVQRAHPLVGPREATERATPLRRGLGLRVAGQEHRPGACREGTASGLQGGFRAQTSTEMEGQAPASPSRRGLAAAGHPPRKEAARRARGLHPCPPSPSPPLPSPSIPTLFSAAACGRAGTAQTCLLLYGPSSGVRLRRPRGHYIQDRKAGLASGPEATGRAQTTARASRATLH